MTESSERAERKGSFRDRIAWQKACDLVEHIYQLTGAFPRTEVYGLTQQMRRAAYSVPANIAEGCARHSKPEFLQFLNIAAGSLAEVETFVELGKRLHFGDAAQYALAEQTAREVGVILHALIASIRFGKSRS